MAYQVLARKWRPQNFTQLVGQEHVSISLCNAIRNDRLHHAYLFTGTRGVGKTTIARIFAKAINCENINEGNPCGECQVCQAFDEGRFLDLIEVDAASRTRVEETRDLLDNVQYAPHQGQYKVYLIDEVHMLSSHSFNALLKTLEEPPPHVKFLLATTDPQKIPVTVLSRCLQFNLKRLLPEQISGQMEFILGQEQIDSENSAVQLLSRAADGSLRDGLSLLDQAIAFGNGEVKLDIVTQMLGTVAQQPVDQILLALANNDAAGLLDKIAEIAELSSDFSTVLEQILRIFHRVVLVQTIPNYTISDIDSDIIEQLASKLSVEDIQLFYQIALIGRRDLDLAPDLKCGFEMVMLRMLTFKPAGETKPAAKAVSISESYVEPVSQVLSEVKESTSSSSNTINVDGNDEWANLVISIKVKGMTRELANNCILESVDDKHCNLLLSPGHSQLISPRAEDNLQQALRDYYGNNIKLNIKSGQANTTTPAQQITRKQEDIQQAAVDSINNDENVLALKEQLGARVMPGTIEPK